jgi:hypothetical protein
VEVEEKVYKAIGQFKKGLFGSGPCRTYSYANLLYICLNSWISSCRGLLKNGRRFPVDVLKKTPSGPYVL